MQSIHEFREVGILGRLADFIVKNNCVVTDEDAPVSA
jgi:hypothetical protein